mmetsp:Transcript_4221/g.6661  ORF Transcript_4221/g.6661 Transcript_4221/m.6661 type:complete len:82 (-) Transcript_4221:218-463(-)
MGLCADVITDIKTQQVLSSLPLSSAPQPYIFLLLHPFSPSAAQRLSPQPLTPELRSPLKLTSLNHKPRIADSKPQNLKPKP